MYEDKDRQKALLKESDVDWMIVRPGFLTNGPRRAEYRAITDLTGVKTGKISRADVAHFIFAQIASPTFLRQTPCYRIDRMCPARWVKDVLMQ